MHHVSYILYILYSVNYNKLQCSIQPSLCLNIQPLFVFLLSFLTPFFHLDHMS